MVGKPLAFGLLVVACVAAAGTGAYFATLQRTQSGTSQSTIAEPRQPPQIPQPVAAAEPAATITNADPTAVTGSTQSPAPGATGSASSAARPKAAGRVVLKPAKDARTGPATEASAQPAVPQSAPRPGDVASNGIAAPLPPVPTGVDPSPQGQRPWPGVLTPPAPPAVPPPVSGEPARTEPEPDAANGARQWEDIVVPAESVLGLQLESSVNTEFARVEDQVDARVTRDVRVGGRVAIPAGTRVIGSVVMVERGGRLKERSRIGLRFNTLVFADSTRVAFATDTIYREGESPANQSSAKIGGAAIGGAIIGAILGGGRGAAIGSGIGAAGGAAAALSGDRMPVVLPAGTTLSVRTHAPFTLTVEK